MGSGPAPSGPVAQRKSAAFTRRTSQVRSLPGLQARTAAADPGQGEGGSPVRRGGDPSGPPPARRVGRMARRRVLTPEIAGSIPARGTGATHNAPDEALNRFDSGPELVSLTVCADEAQGFDSLAGCAGSHRMVAEVLLAAHRVVIPVGRVRAPPVTLRFNQLDHKGVRAWVSPMRT